MKIYLIQLNHPSSTILPLSSLFGLLSPVFCILYSFVKSCVNNEKAGHSREKITKSATNLIQNKPNSPIVQTDLTSFITMNYPIFAGLTEVKNKPNQTQFKANTNPIPGMAKFALSSFITNKYEKVGSRLVKKTNPIQTQFNRLYLTNGLRFDSMVSNL